MPRFKLNPLCAALMLSSMSIPAVSIAQEEALTLEEVIVTARNREESLQEIPVAINAFSAKDIERQNINDMRDVVRASPGVSYDSAGSVSTGAIVIRGMSQPGLISDETNVAIFVDGVYVSGRDAAYMPMMGLERIEVVRGPQSAIYGRNAFSGAMNYITSRPDNEFEAEVEVTKGNHGTQGVKARISGPLIEDLLTASLDVTDDESGSTFKDGDTYLGSLENEAQRLRLVLTPSDDLEFDFSYSHIDMQEKPQAGFEIGNNSETPLLTSGMIGTGVPGLIPMFDYNVDTGALTNPMSWEPGTAEGGAGPVLAGTPLGAVEGAKGTGVESHRFNLTASWNINDDLTLSSITARSTSKTRAITGYDKFYTGDALVFKHPGSTAALDPIIGSITPWEPLGLGTLLYLPTDVVEIPFAPGVNAYIVPFTSKGLGGQPNDDRVDFSQELRIQSNPDEGLLWSAGLLYAKTELDQWLWSAQMDPIADPSIDPMTDPAGYAESLYLSNVALAFNGSALVNGLPPVMQQAEYETTTKSVFFGLEYDFSDKLTASFEGRYTKEDKTTTELVNFGPLNPSADASFEFFSPRLTLTYNADDYTTMYVNIAKGTKSGGINAGGSDTEAKFEPETNITYELGAKRTILDGRGYMNIALYQIDWSDQQIRNFSSNSDPLDAFPSVIVSNLGETQIRGIEIETAFQISESWSFFGGYTFNDAKIKKGIIGPLQGFTDYEAMGLNGTPISTLGSCLNTLDVVGDTGEYCATGPGSDPLVSDGDVAGKQMPNSVRNTANVGLSFSTDLDNGLELYSNVSAVWKDKRYINSNNSLWIEAHTTVNWQLGLVGEHWYGKIAVNNVMNDDTPVTSYGPFTITGGPEQTTVNGNGRMASLSVGYKF